MTMETEGATTVEATNSIATEGASGQAGFVGEDGNFTDGWTQRLPEEMGEARESFSRFKSVNDLAKSYHGLQQLLGRKAHAVVVPNDKSTPEEVTAYRKALGIPEKAEEYLIRPEELPQGVDWNDDLARPFAEIAHRHNIPPSAMRELVAQQARLEAQRSQTMAEMVHEELQQGQRTLQEAWGAKYERNLGLAAKAAQMAGVDPQSRGFMDPEVVKAFARLADMLSEDHFVKGEHAGFQGGAERARDIMTNPQNPLYARYQDGESDTVDLVRRLLQKGN